MNQRPAVAVVGGDGEAVGLLGGRRVVRYRSV
jgi:hypothetical protein